MIAAVLAILLWAGPTSPARAHDSQDRVPRTAVASAFAPELSILKAELDGAVTHSLNGVEFSTGTLQGRPVVLFLSGISVVNAAMTTQLALDHFTIERIVFSGIAGGVDPALHVGDLVIADRWGQYLELVFAREEEEGWRPPPFFDYPYPNYGMMFRAPSPCRAPAPAPERTRRRPASGSRSTRRCWPPPGKPPRRRRSLAVPRPVPACGARPGSCRRRRVSGSAFIDNAAFREYTFETFGARVLDMESAAVAHVAYANGVPFIAVRSLSDLAGGGEGENQLEVFLDLAAGNAAAVVKALLRALPHRPGLEP